MTGESSSSKRSNLVDVTYQQLHAILSGHLEGTSTEQVTQILRPRLDQLRNVAEPFGKPSDASRKKIESGSFTLRDNVVLRIEEADREYIFAISDAFRIDEADALVLLRSFLYNEGLPTHAGSKASKSMAEELVEAITPFYYSERLFILRALIPLFRASENSSDPIHDAATDVLRELLPDGRAFAESLLTEYTRKRQLPLPQKVSSDPRTASRWAKQNAKEQLVILEVLFWTMWSFVSCDGPQVVRIYEAAYDSNLGGAQQNSTLLLDDEGIQLQQDSAALWILIMIEVLELERLAESDGVEVSADPVDKNIYTASPESLKRIHELVISHGDSQYACTYLAWAFVLSRLTTTASALKEVPPNYMAFFDSLLPRNNRAYSKEREPVHTLMSRTCLSPEAGLFHLIQSLLTQSPLFVTAAAWRTGSTVTDPNAVAFRSVLKGLIIALVELVPVEHIPDFEAFVEVWIALFGRSESESVATICRQYWESDWRQGIARRAIFDVARSRFPIHFKPLVRLLRAMTGSGFLDTDPLSTVDHSHEGNVIDESRDVCDRYVFHYLKELSTYSQVIPTSACTGAHASYEKSQERYGSSPVAAGLTYVNLRPTKLPGGTTLPAKSSGRLLSGDGGDFIVVCWQHQHSGWKVILEVLTDYVNRRRMSAGASGKYQDVNFGRRGNSQPATLRLDDIGVEMDDEGDQDIVTDALDLVRSVAQDNPALAQELLESLEEGEHVVAHTMTESQPPDLVQLTTMILEEALSRSTTQSRVPPRPQLITSAMSVLSALLALPNYSHRVWLYIRSTTALFGSDRTVGIASVALAAERVTGHYTMTLALLHLVQQLFLEASSSLVAVLPGNPRLQQVKDEVLLRAARFVHAEIWVEHLGWKYLQLGDRFEIGRRVTSFYADVLRNAPPSVADKPFGVLSQSVTDALLFKATTSSVNPLVSSITSGASMLKILYASRRYGDARRLIFLLESHLHLVRLVLNYKQSSTLATQTCLLEQALCARATNLGSSALDSARTKVDPIEVLATYVRERDVGVVVPLEAMRVLCALCSSISISQPSPPTIIGHLSDPESTVTALVRIIQHPYDDLSLRNAVWTFITLAVDKEPALASLFVTGQFRIPSHIKGKGKATDCDAEASSAQKSKRSSAIDVARTVLEGRKELWRANPQLLTSVLRFLDVVWQHGLEHKVMLDSVIKDAEFWTHISAIACEELGSIPDYHTETYVVEDGVQRSNLHENVSGHAYRRAAKSHALHIIALDIGIHLQTHDRKASEKPISFSKIEENFKSEKKLTALLLEAATSTYDPMLYDELMDQIKADFPALTLEQLRSQEPVAERELGDDFTFSMELLRSRLQTRNASDDAVRMAAEDVDRKLSSINLNLSLAYAETALAESWRFILQQAIPYLRGNASVRPIMLTIAVAVSSSISSEARSGDMMSTIHGTRLSLLLAMVEVAWFSSSDTKAEIQSLLTLTNHVHGIILNEPQSPIQSFLGKISEPFHRTLLQIAYFCTRHCRTLVKRPKAITAEHRLIIASMLEATLNLVIGALRIVFDSARGRLDTDLDLDMELLVAVFEQCTRPDINSSSSQWLARCHETDVVRASLELFVRTDLVGLSDVGLLLARRQPLYSPHILVFHMALASVPSAAERLASQGVLAAYSDNTITSAISTGMIDVVLPEFPGERSPAHQAYCSMLAVISGVILALGRHNHFFDAEASGFVQLYGEQMIRALSWTVGDQITLPLLEELEQTVNLFHAIAESVPSANADAVVDKVLRGFTTNALMLVQQLNYALSHPNQLVSLFEPITLEERVLAEKEPRETSSQMLDPTKRPLLTRLVYRVTKLSSMVISTLVSISRAETVLLGEQEDWPLHEALLVPHSKVVLGEPASMGTLLELGNGTLDLLRDLVNRPAGQAITTVPPAGSPEPALDVRQSVAVARRNLEATLIYAVTQLVMWLSKPDFDAGTDDMEGEDRLAESQRGNSTKERRAPRPSMTVAERLRRGMTGEMAADLQSILSKAKPIIAKSNGVLGAGGVDLTQILSNFLLDRVSS
ncbi:hypothetical protein PLICRDRAFT_33503 [Plicaturopsis crispa FD-325 SS-3]|nr:hypothetical protein PLICRDRAFT_33503 [Plicaturopsis crispa FD-325 SS-3]